MKIRIVKMFMLLGCLSLSLISCADDSCVPNPQSDCFCTKQYDPVCGCNNITYGNACEAGCDGITEYTKGECK
ncbi:MAG: Kazal-type serine protease inhibitor domain-containing protein [Saprospiraceae bacterium]